MLKRTSLGSIIKFARVKQRHTTAHKYMEMGLAPVNIILSPIKFLSWTLDNIHRVRLTVPLGW